MIYLQKSKFCQNVDIFSDFVTLYKQREKGYFMGANIFFDRNCLNNRDFRVNLCYNETKFSSPNTAHSKMNRAKICYNTLTFDDLLHLAQQGDKEAVAHILYKAKYRDYTFYYHMRIIASKYFKYSTDELFDGLVNDLYVDFTKNDFHAIKSFEGSANNSGETLKRIFFGWLMKVAANRFSAERKRLNKSGQCDISKCVISTPEFEYSADKCDEYTILRQAISKLKKEESRIVLQLCLIPGQARRSVNVAKALTKWRKLKGEEREATEAEINCIKSRAYIELRPILIQMGIERKMNKAVKTKSKRQK